jgi:hypothetical protein
MRRLVFYSAKLYSSRILLMGNCHSFLSPSPGLADIEITNLAFGCNLAEDNNVTRTDTSTLIFLHSMSTGLWISVRSKASTADRLKSEDLGISV